MSILSLYSEIQEILVNFPNDAKMDIVSILDEMTPDNYNVLGMYVPNTNFDVLKEQVADDLVIKMNKLIKSFNMDMITLMNGAEAEFKHKVGKKR